MIAMKRLLKICTKNLQGDVQKTWMTITIKICYDNKEILWILLIINFANYDILFYTVIVTAP